MLLRAPAAAERNDVRLPDGADDTGARERRAVRWWRWGLPLCGPQWPMPCADRKRRGGCVRRALCGAGGPQNGGGEDVWMAGSWRAVWSRLMRCVALLCFLGQRELSSTSPLQRLPLPLVLPECAVGPPGPAWLFSSAGQLA